MRGSPIIYRFIGHEEALVTVPYLDGQNRNGTPRYSQGFGEGGVPADNPPWTEEHAFERFKARLGQTEAELNKALRVEVSQQEYDALLAALDNRGMTQMKPVLDLVNTDKKPRAWALLRSLCVSSGGDYIEGLAKRRDSEIKIALHADYGAPNTYKLYVADPRKTQPIVKMYPDDF